MALALTALLWFVGACQSPTQNPYDSKERLVVLMEQWREIQRNGWRCEDSAALRATLEQSFEADGPSLVVIPIDYAENRKLTQRLGEIDAHL